MEWLTYITINISNVQNRLGRKMLLHPSMSTLCTHLQWEDGADQSTSTCICRYPWRRQLVLNILEVPSCKCTNCELTEHLLYALHTKWHAGNSSQLWYCFESYTGVWTFSHLWHLPVLSLHKLHGDRPGSSLAQMTERMCTGPHSVVSAAHSCTTTGIQLEKTVSRKETVHYKMHI